MFKIAVFVSGSGSNMDAIINAIDSNNIKNSKIEIIVSDRNCYAIEKAKNKKLNTKIVSRKKLKEDGWDLLLIELNKLKIDLIVLAGYLSIVNENFIKVFQGKIINIHPSLLPKYSGMFGMNIHQSVINNSDKYTGVTVHYVNEIIDGGEIIKQEIVEVSLNETAQSLANKVLKVEHCLLISSIKLILHDL